MKNEREKCYCLEIFKKKYGDHVQGECLKLACTRYRTEKSKEEDSCKKK